MQIRFLCQSWKRLPMPASPQDLGPSFTRLNSLNSCATKASCQVEILRCLPQHSLAQFLNYYGSGKLDQYRAAIASKD